jgi:hypothetical protein
MSLSRYVKYNKVRPVIFDGPLPLGFFGLAFIASREGHRGMSNITGFDLLYLIPPYVFCVGAGVRLEAAGCVVLDGRCAETTWKPVRLYIESLPKSRLGTMLTWGAGNMGYVDFATSRTPQNWYPPR